MSTATPALPNSDPVRPVPLALWRGAIFLFSLTVVLQFVAIWSQSYLPLVDLSNHTARHFLTAQAQAGAVSPFYEIHWRLVPNLGGDLTIPWLMRVMPPETAMLLAVTLAVLGFGVGACWFLWEQRASQIGGCLACLLILPWIFNSPLFWGFFNFFSGLAVMCFALVQASRLLRQETLHWFSLLLHTVLVTVLFFWHLAAWGNYGLILGGLLLGWCWENRTTRGWGFCLRRFFLLILPTLPAVVLLVIYVVSNRGQSESDHFEWGTWQRKLARMATQFGAYSSLTDLTVLLLWLGAIVVGFRLEKKPERRSTGLWIALALQGVFYLLLPYQLGSTSDTDTRLLPPMLLCVLALLGSWPTRRIGIAMMLLALAIGVRYVSITVAWHQMGERVRVAVASFENIPPGSRVLPVVSVPILSKDWPECHVAGWAVVHRNAFVPNLFAIRDQQPLRIRDELRPALVEYNAVVGPDASIPPTEFLRQHYDYVWLFDSAGQHQLPAEFPRVYENGPILIGCVPRK